MSMDYSHVRGPMYLGNYKKAEHPDIEAQIAAASIASGILVEWSDKPMPETSDGPRGYNYEHCLNEGYGCLFSYHRGDKSAFWKAFRE